MRIYCIGNSIVSGDNIPPELSTEIGGAFPDADVKIIDPSENFYPEEGNILIDSVEGIDRVRIFEDIAVFASTKSVSVHDYDLGFHLQLLKKLNKLPHIWIIGIPQCSEVKVVLPQILSAVEKCLGEERKNQR